MRYGKHLLFANTGESEEAANQLNYDRDADDIWALFKLFPVAVLVAYFNCHHLALELGLKLTKRNLCMGWMGNLNLMFASL